MSFLGYVKKCYKSYMIVLSFFIGSVSTTPFLLTLFCDLSLSCLSCHRTNGNPASAMYGDNEDPYPSLSDFHDYEPNLEFDDTELEQAASTGKNYYFLFCK